MWNRWRQPTCGICWGRDQSEGRIDLVDGEQPPRPRPFQELGADLSAALRACLTLRAERAGRPLVLLSGPLPAVPCIQVLAT
jgi:hypothetical protein